ncbi:MAG: porin family protein [Flavobacterium sp.]|nr:porin family protein [Flavobacterium sp.]
MKKIVLSLAAVLAFGFANAQDKKENSGEGFGKGDIFITGAFSVGSTNDKNTDVKTNSFEIAPQVNYFLTENISLGAKIGYTSDKAENAVTDTQDDSTITFGLQGRYYFTPASKFSLFTGLGFDYNSTSDNLADPKVKTNGFDLGLGLGVNYFISDNFSIEAGFAALNFESSKVDVDGAENETAFGIGADLRALSFGLNYRF